MFAEQLYYQACSTLNELETVLDRVSWKDVERLCYDIEVSNKIFFVGVGRTFLALQSFAKRLGHLGYNVHCVGEICEPAISKGDLLIVGSGSGKSIVPVVITNKARTIQGVRIVQIGSEVGDVEADYLVQVPTVTKSGNKEGKIESNQIMTSLFEQSLWILGDVICRVLVDKRGLDLKDLWQCHANLE